MTTCGGDADRSRPGSTPRHPAAHVELATFERTRSADRSGALRADRSWPFAGVRRHRDDDPSWVRQADLDSGRRKDGLTTEERQELTQLRRENARPRAERAILKKATAW